jgi:hypothetical protein
MDRLINEGLTLISTVIALPVAAVLTWAFFTGRLTRTEAARYTPVIEDDVDYWSPAEQPTPQPGEEPRIAQSAGGGVRA